MHIALAPFVQTVFLPVSTCSPVTGRVEKREPDETRWQLALAASPHVRFSVCSCSKFQQYTTALATTFSMPIARTPEPLRPIEVKIYLLDWL